MKKSLAVSSVISMAQVIASPFIDFASMFKAPKKDWQHDEERQRRAQEKRLRKQQKRLHHAAG